MDHTISVMIVEDSVEYRNAVKLALESENDLQLFSEFGTAEIAIRMIRDDAVTTQPDVVLLDVRLPGMPGLDAIEPILDTWPECKIIVLTQSDSEADVVRAISQGASGYLLKSSTLTELVDGIRKVAQGDAVLDPSVANYILKSFRNQPVDSPTTSILSDRELEVLTLLAQGLVKKEIANQLSIGYSTVDTHVGRIYNKLNVRNAPSAVNKAHLMNLFAPPSTPGDNE